MKSFEIKVLVFPTLIFALWVKYDDIELVSKVFYLISIYLIQ